jgi:hypothetical protein
MEKIILLNGRNKRTIAQYRPTSLSNIESSAASPFWLDLLSPSERLLKRTGVGLTLNPGALRACFSLHSSTGCEDFGDYLFVKAPFLEPSKRSLFMQRDLKVFLSSEYLITIHKRRDSLLRLLPSVEECGFERTGTLLLVIFEQSICRLIRSVYFEESRGNLPAIEKDRMNRNPSWWRLKNLRAALNHDLSLVHELAFVGSRFFCPEDRDTFGSLKANIRFLRDMVDALLSQNSTSTNAVRSTKTFS